MDDFKRIEVVSDENLKKRMASLLDPRGVFQLVHRSRHGEIISIDEFRNLVTNQGKNYILDSAISTNTPVSPVDNWYFIIITGAFTAAAGSTYASPGGTEDTGYDETLRQEWDNGDSSSQAVSNGTAATITSTSTLAITGIGVVGSPSGHADADTKGDTTSCTDGILLSESAVSKSLSAAETLDITYTLSC